MHQKSSWEKATEINTIEAYSSFLEKYPEGEYTDSAKSKIEFICYRNAANDNSIRSWRNFVEKFKSNPKSSYVDSAEHFLHELSWEKVQKNHTVDSYSKFIDQFPNSKYLQIAKDKKELAFLSEEYKIVEPDILKFELEGLRDYHGVYNENGFDVEETISYYQYICPKQGGKSANNIIVPMSGNF